MIGKLSQIAIAGAFAAMSVTATAEEVVVGVVLPMTGALASWAGPPQYRGIQVALDEIAATKMLGDGRTIKLLLEDDASDKTQSITLTNRLIARDKAALILGPSSSPLAAAAAPIANQNKTPMIAIAVSEEITKTGPWVYKIYQGPGPTITAAAKYMVDKLKVQSVAIVYARDNEAMVAYTKVMRDYLTAAGVKVEEETVQATETDFTALATKLASKKVDAVFLNLLPESAANLAIQARQAGMSPNVKLVGSDQLGAQSYAKIGGGAVKGTFYPTFYFGEGTKAPNPEFVAAYKKKFNAEPDQYAAVGYTSMMIGATAVKNAGANADKEKIRASLAAIKNVPTVLGAGTFTFDENRNPTYGVLMMTVDGDKPKPAP
jgi:branched-chain amino acid transport system substrate-binding protein